VGLERSQLLVSVQLLQVLESSAQHRLQTQVDLVGLDHRIPILPPHLGQQIPVADFLAKPINLLLVQGQQHLPHLVGHQRRLDLHLHLEDLSLQLEA
jgi:hypothetical protein